MADRLLPDLTGADLHDSAGQDGHDLWRLRVCGLLVRLGEIKVADDDGRLVTQAGRHRRTAAPDGGAIDDIVVHEGGRMRELRRYGGRGQPVEVVRADPRRQQDEGGPDALAAGGEQVGHWSGDDVGIGLDQATEARFDGCEVAGNRSEELGPIAYVVCFSQS